MNSGGMKLLILLPCQVLAEVPNVRRIAVETTEGALGLLPRRLDCVAILKPGVLTYQAGEDEIDVVVEAGVLVKSGLNVAVSVRDAILHPATKRFRPRGGNR